MTSLFWFIIVLQTSSSIWVTLCPGCYSYPPATTTLSDQLCSAKDFSMWRHWICILLRKLKRIYKLWNISKTWINVNIKVSVLVKTLMKTSKIDSHRITLFYLYWAPSSFLLNVYLVRVNRIVTSEDRRYFWNVETFWVEGIGLNWTFAETNKMNLPISET